MNDDSVVRAAMLGGMSGLRSTAGVAAVSNGLAAHPEWATGPLQRTLARPLVARALTLAVVGECVADKLPMIPPRIDPIPLTGRVTLGALAALAGTQRLRDSRLAAAVIGGAAALATAFLAYYLRRDLTRHGTRDPVVAITEDLTVLEAARQSMHVL